MRKEKTRGLAAKCILLLAIGGMVLVAACSEKQRRPSRYLIPEGYVGSVRINFGVENAPEVPIEDGRFLFTFPSSGLIETSSEIEYGWATDDYYYYSGNLRSKLPSTGWGYGGMIWGGFNGSSGNSYDQRTDVHEYIFVGTEEEFKQFGSEKDEDYQPKVGNLKYREPI